MKKLKSPVSASIEVKKSRFTAYLHNCADIDSLKALRDNLREANKGARHVVYAAVFGDKGEIFACSDDKEPRNTAGRPCLDVLRGCGATNIAVLVVRYFGGILLGTGGLSHAYSDSVKAALSQAEFIEMIDEKKLVLDVEYSTYNGLLYFLKQNGAAVCDQKMNEKIELSISFEKSAEERIVGGLMSIKGVHLCQ